MGFSRAVSLALGEGDTVYVLNRGAEQIKDVPWNRSIVGARVGKFTIGPVPGDEEFVADIGRPGDGPGQFIWPAGLALDSQENVYVTDEWLNRVSIFDKDGNFLRDWGVAGSGSSRAPLLWYPHFMKSRFATSETFEITEYEPNRRLAWKATAGAQATTTWGMEPSGPSTRITFTREANAHGLLRLPQSLLQGLANGRVDQDLGTLKELLAVTRKPAVKGW